MDDKTTISNLFKIIYHQQQQLHVMHDLIQKQYEPSVVNQPHNSIPESITIDPQNQTINPIPSPITPLPPIPMQPRPMVHPQIEMIMFNGEQLNQIRTINYSGQAHKTLKERRGNAKQMLDVLAHQEAISSSSNYKRREKNTCPERREKLLEILNKRDKSPEPASRQEDSFINWDEFDKKMAHPPSK